MKTLQVIIVASVLYLTVPAIAIYVTLCDCNKPSVKGILDIEKPQYFNDDKLEHHLTKEKLEYQMITTTRSMITWTCYACSQWLRVKRITGAFWVGVYDTVISTETINVEPEVCWEMIQTHK